MPRSCSAATSAHRGPMRNDRSSRGPGGPGDSLEHRKRRAHLPRRRGDAPPGEAPLGFSLDAKEVRRAGLDYWERIPLRLYDGLGAMWSEEKAREMLAAAGLEKALPLPQPAPRPRALPGAVHPFLEKDLPQLGVRVPSETLRRFWTMHERAALGLRIVKIFVLGGARRLQEE